MPLFLFVTIQALNWVFGVPVSYINWSEINLIVSLANLESVNIFLQGIMAFIMIAVPGIFAMFVNDLTIDTSFEDVQVTKTEYVPMQVQISNRERSWGIQKAYTLAGPDVMDFWPVIEETTNSWGEKQIDLQVAYEEQTYSNVYERTVMPVDFVVSEGEMYPNLLEEIKAALKIEQVKKNTKMLLDLFESDSTDWVDSQLYW